jgi:hypothetical protein
MRGSDPILDGPALCTGCGARLPDGASFCPSCGQPVARSRDAASGGAEHADRPRTPAKAPSASAGKAGRHAGRANHQVREALITLFVLGVAAVIVAAVALSRLGGAGDGGATTPPAGVIWFGDSYDSTTFVLRERWTSTTAGRPMAEVAHLTSPVAAGEATLHISLGGSVIANQPLNGLASPGNLIGLSFTPPEPGSYTFTITGSDGATLASGTISVS